MKTSFFAFVLSILMTGSAANAQGQLDESTTKGLTVRVTVEQQLGLGTYESLFNGNVVAEAGHPFSVKVQYEGTKHEAVLAFETETLTANANLVATTVTYSRFADGQPSRIPPMRKTALVSKQDQSSIHFSNSFSGQMRNLRVKLIRAN